jgi:hypothetical protein
MSHFMYVLLFLLASSAVATILQAESREQAIPQFVRRFLTPLGVFAGVSWFMFLLGLL